MHTRKSILAIIIVTVAIAAQSCSVINTLFERNVKTEQPVPTERETVRVDKDVKPYTSKELAKGVISGDWAVEQVSGAEATGEQVPYLKFVPTDSTVYGSNGCNTINARYHYSSADSTLTFTNVATTMRLCADAPAETAINRALADTRHYTWDVRDSQHRLYLLDADHNLLMTLMHQSFQFLNGAWQVTQVNGQAVENPDMNLVFDVDQLKVHGNTGCNVLNGRLATNTETANTISFEGIRTTRMACPDIQGQVAMLAALEEATSVRPLSADRVAFLNADRQVVIELRRTTLSHE